MAFWSTNDVEPKRNFRFQVQITGLTDLGAPTDILWWAKTVTTPSFDVSEVEHNYLDNKFYFPGRVSWNEVSLTLVDPISVDAVQITIEQWILNNPFIKSAKYGDLDYSSDDLRTVEMTIRYDWATCSNDSPLQFEPK